jgi:para-aminobenzoate synthetase/4-amino-4-deoxychorismate lyase
MSRTSRPPATKPGAQHDVASALDETFVLLDNSSGTPAPSLLFTEPKEIVVADEPEDVAAALDRIDYCVSRGLYAAGFFAYELGYVLEPRLRPLLPSGRTVPLIWIGLYEEPRALCNAETQQWLSERTSGAYEFSDVRHAWDAEEYRKRFEAVQEKIRAGDIYQLNLTFKACFRLTGSPMAFYRDLRQKQRVAYGGIVDTGEVTVLSASPELFITKDDRTIFTRPMKGTSPRGGTPEADAENARILASDVKQRAENLMIVDLMRNDIGRISEVGSVEVTDLFTVETYRTLLQMTSGVRARLLPGIGILELLKAIFPPGSVTGAPKIRAEELIADYETEPRGVYCGAIGYMAPDGAAQFNVAIRTPVMFRDGTGEMGIGSGVVFDSSASKEYAECLLKMKFLTDPPKAFELIETFLYDPATGGFWLQDRHFARLAASARYFRFVYDEAAARARLKAGIAGHESERLRVRLTLAEDGRVTVTHASLPKPATPPVMRYAVSPTRVSSTDAFLFHKTTRRETYDREWQEFHDRLGSDEVIYLNERGELAEGSRTNIFVERGGTLMTPALSSGLLPGTLRADLLASGRAVEAVLMPADLESAEAVYLGNSVRGLVAAVPV